MNKIEKQGLMNQYQRWLQSDFLPEEEKIRRSDFTIYNDNSHSLILQVAEIMPRLN